jgi:hypothetical protein
VTSAPLVEHGGDVAAGGGVSQVGDAPVDELEAPPFGHHSWELKPPRVPPCGFDPPLTPSECRIEIAIDPQDHLVRRCLAAFHTSDARDHDSADPNGRLTKRLG